MCWGRVATVGSRWQDWTFMRWNEIGQGLLRVGSGCYGLVFEEIWLMMGWFGQGLLLVCLWWPVEKWWEKVARVLNFFLREGGRWWIVISSSLFFFGCFFLFFSLCSLFITCYFSVFFFYLFVFLQCMLLQKYFGLPIYL